MFSKPDAMKCPECKSESVADTTDFAATVGHLSSLQMRSPLI
jgi:hypothetical protein